MQDFVASAASLFGSVRAVFVAASVEASVAAASSFFSSASAAGGVGGAGCSARGGVPGRHGGGVAAHAEKRPKEPQRVSTVRLFRQTKERPRKKTPQREAQATRITPGRFPPRGETIRSVLEGPRKIPIYLSSYGGSYDGNVHTLSPPNDDVFQPRHHDGNVQRRKRS